SVAMVADNIAKHRAALVWIAALMFLLGIVTTAVGNGNDERPFTVTLVEGAVLFALPRPVVAALALLGAGRSAFGPLFLIQHPGQAPQQPGHPQQTVQQPQQPVQPPQQPGQQPPAV